MAVQLRVPTVLRKHVGGAASLNVHGRTIGEALADATRQFPPLAGQIVTEDGTLHKFLNLYRNDEDVRFLDKLDTTITDQDVISILPAVAGGSHRDQSTSALNVRYASAGGIREPTNGQRASGRDRVRRLRAT